MPQRWRAPVGWVIGWLSLVGNITGAASSEFGLARQIWAAYTLSRPAAEQWEPTAGQLVYVYILLLIVHGAINCLATRYLARLTTSFIFVNLGAAIAIVIALAVTTSPKNSAEYMCGRRPQRRADAPASQRSTISPATRQTAWPGSSASLACRASIWTTGRQACRRYGRRADVLIRPFADCAELDDDGL